MIDDIICAAKIRAQTAARGCYALVTEDIDKPGPMFAAVKTLVDAGYFAKIYVAGGTVFGYVFCHKEELASANYVAEQNGFKISPVRTPLLTASMVWKYPLN